MSRGGKLFFIGIGSGEAAAEFAAQLEIDPSLCFADAEGAAYEAVGLSAGLGTMWNPSAVGKMMDRNDQQSLTALGEAYTSAANNVGGFQKLAPQGITDTLRQGGTFVYRGATPVLEHIDQKVGDNCDIDAILAAVA